MDNLMYQK